MRRRAAALVLLAACSLGLRCARNTETVALDEPITPPGTVEREPYLVVVTDSSAVVRWTTFNNEQPGIRFWTEAADTTSLVLSSEGTNHTFEMLDLQPDTEYTYQIQINDTLWSSSGAFRTFPMPGSKDAFQFIVFGDTGTLSAGQIALAQRLNEQEARLAIHMGDLAYPDGTPDEYTIKHFGVYAPLLKRVPVFPIPGDHDWRTQQGQVYAEIFTPPDGRNSDSPFYYSFTFGNVRFIGLDTEDEPWHTVRFGFLGDPSSEQYQWLLRELSAARVDPLIDWTVVYFHHPPYSSSTGFAGHGSSLAMRRTLAPLFDGYRVPLVFSGHDHDYQRTRPLRGNRVVDENEGTVYVISGGGGGRTTFRGTGADWFTAFSEQAFQYVRVRVEHYQMEIEAIGTDGRVIDSFELTIPEDRRKPWVRPMEPLALPALSGEPGEPDSEAATSRATTRP